MQFFGWTRSRWSVNFGSGVVSFSSAGRSCWQPHIKQKIFLMDHVFLISPGFKEDRIQGNTDRRARAFAILTRMDGR